MALSRPRKEDRGQALPLSRLSPPAIGGVMPALALCPHVVSQAPQYLIFSETEAARGGRFPESVRLITFLTPACPGQFNHWCL